MINDFLESKVFDELKQSVGSDFALELVSTFLDEAPKMLADLRASFSSKDAEPFRRTAHSLKTNSLTFGARALAEYARKLELTGLPADPSDLDQLESIYFETEKALRTLSNG